MKTKVCNGCKRRKKIKEFNRSAYQRSSYRCRCKDCERTAARVFYQNNPAPYKRRAVTQKQRTRRVLLACVAFLKKQGCSFCPEKAPCVLDFHHLSKGAPVGRCVSHSFARFLREVVKCILTCANCHRKCHAGLLTPKRSMLIKFSRKDIQKFI
jgi:hypothetical protein